MWRKMKKVLVILPLLLLVTGMWSESKASHLQGIDLTYECLNNCTIRVYLRAYRDCRGSSFISNNVSFNPQPPCTASGPNPVTAWSPQQTTEVTPICSTTPTRCSQTGATIGGVEEFYWFRDYDICSTPNCVYSLSWTTCCRNPAITSLTNPGSQSMYIGSTTLNTGLTNCNSSPQFANPPVPYLCAGQTFTFNQGAFDPDGDSLSYSFGPCFTTGIGNQVPYATGYSGVNPLGPTWQVVMNPLTGDITITPNPTGSQVVGVLCVYVTEWRNGQAINTIVRDIQVTVIPCPNNTQPVLDTLNPAYGVQGGILNSSAPAVVFTVCAGTQATITLPISDPDAGQINTVYWNQNIPGGNFFQQGNPSVVDTIRGNNPVAVFQWTPPAQGQYSFLVTAVDDACPILGQVQFTVQVNVNGGLIGSSATATPTGCTNVAFAATPGTGGTGPYTYQWSGDGNLNLNPSNNTASFSHTYPGPGSYAYNCLITDAFGCTGVIMDTVVILTGPTADAGPDISLCSGNNVGLGMTPQPGTTYSWIGSAGLSSTTVSNPTLNYTVTGATPDTLTWVFTATQGFCTAVDYVTVIAYPTPVANIAGPNQICNGTSATLTATGGSSYLWSNGATTPSITVSPTTTTTYTVTAIDNGCASAPVAFTVNVTDGPLAIISGTDSVCAGGTATLTVVGGTSWQWSTGSTGQTITLTNITTPTTVTVVPSQAGCLGAPVSHTVYVHESPVADFSFTTECFENPTQFTDLSTISTGSIVSWNWNFGDPNSGNNNFSGTKDPAHQFTAPGTYSVTLYVTASNGCLDTLTQNVTVNPLPDPNFEFTDVCEGEVMTFVDATPGNITTWLYDFGDNSTPSSQQNPTHLYQNPGAYNVTLTVTDNNGCMNSVVKTVFVHPLPDPSFTYSSRCFNTITDFVSTSTLNDPFGTTIDAVNWNFGDPSSSNNTGMGANVTHSYPSPGNYLVTMTVTTSQGCTQTIQQQITIDPVSPLTINNVEICRGYSAYLIVSNVPANHTVEWYYTATGTNPFHTGVAYATPPLSQTTGYYVVLLAPDGCRSNPQWIQAQVWSEPSISLSVNANVVEVPNAIVEFTTTLLSSSSNIVSYFWDFGDGTNSDAANPIHQYSEAGLYDVTLTIVDQNGCETVYRWEDYIEVLQRVRIFVPTGFTPNQDEANDFFLVQTTLVSDLSIQIYDRWGRQIFASDNIGFTWDGKDKTGQPMPEGVYIYNIQATTYDGQKIKKSGSITLIR